MNMKRVLERMVYGVSPSSNEIQDPRLDQAGFKTIA
jgi:hypothetical protein